MTNSNAAQQVADWLAENGYTVIPPPPPPPVHVCAVCGATDEENEAEGYGPLVDVEVRVAFGEEGTADPTRYFCDLHLKDVTGALLRYGFAVHRHGGINFLEPHDCPGYTDPGNCPTPVDAEAGDED